jgi:hypothetical protein
MAYDAKLSLDTLSRKPAVQTFQNLFLAGTIDLNGLCAEKFGIVFFQNSRGPFRRRALNKLLHKIAWFSDFLNKLLCDLPAAPSFARALGHARGVTASVRLTGIARRRGPDRAPGLLAERPEVGDDYRVCVTAPFASSVEHSL